jgi:hypothetical protein
MCVGATFSIRGECLPCNEPQVINAGEHTTCTKCPAGKGPVPARTGCQDCTGNTYSNTETLGTCRKVKDGYAPTENHVGEVDIDECSTNNGGCDPLMGTETSEAPCLNSDGGYKCSACPLAYLLNETTSVDTVNITTVLNYVTVGVLTNITTTISTCEQKAVETGGAASSPMTEIQLGMSEEELSALLTPGSALYAAKVANISASLGIAASDFTVEFVPVARRRLARRHLAATTTVKMRIVVTSTQPEVQKQTFARMTEQLKSPSSLLVQSLGGEESLVNGLLDAHESISLGISCPPGSKPKDDQSRCIPCKVTKTSVCK